MVLVTSRGNVTALVAGVEVPAIVVSCLLANQG